VTPLRTTGWRPALAPIVGLIVALALFMSPAAEWAARSAVVSDSASISVRQRYYTATKESIRDHRGYSLAHEDRPLGHRDLVLFGSSELSSEVPQNPRTLLPTKVSDFDLYLSGRGYTQSLAHAIELAAISDQLPQPRRVALIISPQWFTTEGATKESFAEVFSAPQMAAMMGNPNLRPATRAAVLERARSLSAGSPWFPAVTGLRTALTSALRSPADALQRRADVLKAISQASRSTASMTAPFKVQPGSVSIGRFDWTAARSEGEAQGRAATSNNQFAVLDSYFDKYIRERLPTLKGSLESGDYSGASPEWADLQLFLDVAKDLQVEVLLISVPMNGRWYDYAGYPQARRAHYYDRIRQVATSAGVQLADLSSHEYEPYFLVDIMHLGWKGWLDVTEACARFALA